MVRNTTRKKTAKKRKVPKSSQVLGQVSSQNEDGIASGEKEREDESDPDEPTFVGSEFPPLFVGTGTIRQVLLLLIALTRDGDTLAELRKSVDANKRSVLEALDEGGYSENKTFRKYRRRSQLYHCSLLVYDYLFNNWMVDEGLFVFTPVLRKPHGIYTIGILCKSTQYTFTYDDWKLTPSITHPIQLLVAGLFPGRNTKGNPENVATVLFDPKAKKSTEKLHQQTNFRTGTIVDKALKKSHFASEASVLILGCTRPYTERADGTSHRDAPLVKEEPKDGGRVRDNRLLVPVFSPKMRRKEAYRCLRSIITLVMNNAMPFAGVSEFPQHCFGHFPIFEAVLSAFLRVVPENIKECKELVEMFMEHVFRFMEWVQHSNYITVSVNGNEDVAGVLWNLSFFSDEQKTAEQIRVDLVKCMLWEGEWAKMRSSLLQVIDDEEKGWFTFDDFQELLGKLSLTPRLPEKLPIDVKLHLMGYEPNAVKQIMRLNEGQIQKCAEEEAKKAADSENAAQKAAADALKKAEREKVLAEEKTALARQEAALQKVKDQKAALLAAEAELKALDKAVGVSAQKAQAARQKSEETTPPSNSGCPVVADVVDLTSEDEPPRPRTSSDETTPPSKSVVGRKRTRTSSDETTPPSKSVVGRKRIRPSSDGTTPPPRPKSGGKMPRVTLIPTIPRVLEQKKARVSQRANKGKKRRTG